MGCYSCAWHDISRKSRRLYRQKTFLDAYVALTKLTYHQLMWKIAAFGKYRESKEITTRTDKTVTMLVRKLLPGLKYIAVRAEWFTVYIKKA